MAGGQRGGEMISEARQHLEANNMLSHVWRGCNGLDALIRMCGGGGSACTPGHRVADQVQKLKHRNHAITLAYNKTDSELDPLSRDGQIADVFENWFELTQAFMCESMSASVCVCVCVCVYSGVFGNWCVC